MLNNKGQSLVLFILIIPILLGVMALVIDVGNAFVKKNEIDGVIEFVLDSELSTEEVSNEILEEEIIDNTDTEGVDEYLEDDLVSKDESIKVLLDYNLKGTQNESFVEDGVITIKVKTYVEGIFSNILNIRGFPIESEYHGYIENEEKIIEKIK